MVKADAREKAFSQPSNVHLYGRSLVWTRMC